MRIMILLHLRPADYRSTKWYDACPARTERSEGAIPYYEEVPS